MIALPFQDRKGRDHLEQAGINAERQLAHYLGREFGDDPRVDLFFGLRIPLDRATGSRQDAVQMQTGLVSVDRCDAASEPNGRGDRDSRDRSHCDRCFGQRILREIRVCSTAGRSAPLVYADGDGAGAEAGVGVRQGHLALGIRVSEVRISTRTRLSRFPSRPHPSPPHSRGNSPPATPHPSTQTPDPETRLP